jgi:hypothetical protein
MNAYEYGYKMGMVIDGRIEGIYASRNREKHGLLAQSIRLAGDGDHLEVGTLYGASAILAAMTKKKYGLKGAVWCVDPFVDADIDPSIKELTDYKVSLVRVLNNASTMGVNVIPKKVPFSEYDIEGVKFASAYIDGDHTYEGVKHDWEKAAPHVDSVVMFDDYNDPRFPGVQKFIDELDDPEWDKNIHGQFVEMRRK